VRTLSSLSRAIGTAALVIAAALLAGGAFFVGYVSELQRGLNDPAAPHAEAARHIAALEQSLGYAGFLKTYRDYRTAADPKARGELTRQTLEASHALAALRHIYDGNATAEAALREAESVGGAFAQVAQAAPQPTGSALRGTASANDLPQAPQLEAAYLSLRGALDRLRMADQNRQLGGAAYALNWSQIVIIAALCVLVISLLTTAALLHLGIIYPLKSLEQSLTAMGEGTLTQPVWGQNRRDEFGALAKAGEKLRRSLTETSALRTLAGQGQLHLTLDGQSSILLERLAGDVTAATQALKAAAADFARLQDGNRKQLDAALAGFQASTEGVNATTISLQADATAAIAAIRTSTDAINEAASHRAHRLDKIAGRLDQGRRNIDDAVTGLIGRTTSATEEIAASAAALKTAADSTAKIHGTLTASLEDVTSGATKATTTVRTLAARLSDTIGLVDERLSRKLAALNALEQTVAANLAALRAKADETSKALLGTAAALDERTAKLASQPQNDFAAAIARLDEIAERMANPSASAPAAPQDLQPLADALQTQLENVRSEIRDLAVRITEERILSSAGTDFAALPGDTASLEPQRPHRTLADVPSDEILARLKDLAAEMNATEAEAHHDETAPLKEALSSFAIDVRSLAANADRVAKLKAMGRALDQHADDIEAHAPAVGPSAALRTELQSITGELRDIAARAQANGSKDGPRLREAAIEVGARAESLFTYLNETHPGAHATEEAPTHNQSDIDALSGLIARIERRAESEAHIAGDLSTNSAIHTVFESIGRLNNIATALSRASSGDRRRHTAH
jgi:methyl-accepting chemotaxis protein